MVGTLSFFHLKDTKPSNIISLHSYQGNWKDTTGWGCTLCDLTSLAHFFTSACFSSSVSPFALKPHKNCESTKSLMRKVILPSGYFARGRKTVREPFATMVSFWKTFVHLKRGMMGREACHEEGTNNAVAVPLPWWPKTLALTLRRSPCPVAKP